MIEEFADLRLDLLPGIRSIDEIRGLPVQVASRGPYPPEIFLQGGAGVDAGTAGAADPLCEDTEVRVQENHDAGAMQDVGVPSIADGAASQGDDYPFEIREAPTQSVLSFAKGKPAFLLNWLVEAPAEFAVRLPVEIGRASPAEVEAGASCARRAGLCAGPAQGR